MINVLKYPLCEEDKGLLGKSTGSTKTSAKDADNLLISCLDLLTELSTETDNEYYKLDADCRAKCLAQEIEHYLANR